MEPLRILIVGEDALARSGLALMLGGEGGIAVVATAAPDSDLESALRVHRPQAALWDLGFADPPELDAIRRLAGLPVVAILSSADHVPDVLSVGARGLILRDGDGERLKAALQAVAQGLLVLDPALADAALRPAAAVGELVEPLTPREAEVLHLLAQGLSNKAIAERLRISEHTAKFHVNAILGKLGAQSRTEAIVQAIRQGLVVL